MIGRILMILIAGFFIAFAFGMAHALHAAMIAVPDSSTVGIVALFMTFVGFPILLGIVMIADALGRD